MATYKCPECKGRVSYKATTCPHCGAPVTPQPQASKKTKLIVAGAMTLLAVSCIGVVAVSDKKDPNAPPKDLDKIEALTMCQMAIAKVSRDPEKADIPYIEGYETDKEFTFKWDKNTKLARLRNGLGLEVGVPAFCSVDKEARKLTSLVVDNTNILAN